MKHNFARRIVVGALATGAGVALVVTGPAAAFAAPNTATNTGASTGATTTTQVSSPKCTAALFGSAQQVVEANLAARVAQLNALSAAVNSTVNHLTAGDRQTLSTDITTVELPGIQALVSQAQAATTCRALRVVAHAMVYNFRVYVVMSPQTHLTIVTDDETSIEGVFVNLEPQVAAAIERAQNAGKDVSAAQAAFTDLKNQVTTAQSATNGQSALLLAQTPTGYPGNWNVFLTARTNATNARAALRTAYTDAQHIRTDLQ